MEDLLTFPQDEAQTLSLLDSTLRRFLTLCSTYHGIALVLRREMWLIARFFHSAEQYLQSPLQLEHAIGMLLDSELFQFHSERMSEIIVQDAQNVTSSRTLGLFSLPS